MNSTKLNASLIIATYNWKEALELVLLSLLNQTQKVFEIIIADDGSKSDTKILIEKYKNKFSMPLIHVWHEDKGFRLAEIRNKAIKKAEGNYIIQIDGDVILHKDFLKDHMQNAQKNTFLVGSRVLLGKKISQKIIQTKKITFNFFTKDIKNRQYTIKSSTISKILKSPTDDIQKVIRSVRGCNMSFWKKDLLKINGYDEDMVGWGREDSEISARLINNGLTKQKLKFSGIQYHIYHPDSSREGLNLNDEILENTISKNKIFASNGIEKGKRDAYFERKISAIIPTFNEERNIEGAILSLKFADEIIVIDSFSTDKTIEIAKKHHVKIIQRKFDNFSSQKNYAIKTAKYDWIFMLDADERLTEKSKREIFKKIKKIKIPDAFWMYRQNFFLNKKINYSGWQKDKVIKFFNRNKAKYNGKLVHEEIECTGTIGFLSNKLLHYTYVDYNAYKNKLALYSKLKAKELFAQKLKPNFYHFYIKPAYRYFYHYIIKFGFLDGKNGKIIAAINAFGVKNRYVELEKLYKNN